MFFPFNSFQVPAKQEKNECYNYRIERSQSLMQPMHPGSKTNFRLNHLKILTDSAPSWCCLSSLRFSRATLWLLFKAKLFLEIMQTFNQWKIKWMSNLIHFIWSIGHFREENKVMMIIIKITDFLLNKRSPLLNAVGIKWIVFIPLTQILYQ